MELHVYTYNAYSCYLCFVHTKDGTLATNNPQNTPIFRTQVIPSLSSTCRITWPAHVTWS